MKINIDTALFQDLGLGGFGVVARDSQGNFLGGRSFRSYCQLNPAVMEANAMFTSLKLALEQGWQDVIMESDCLKVIEDMWNNTNVSFEVGVIYQNIHSVSRNFISYSFSFVRSEANLIAHILARRVQWFQDGVVWVNQPLSFLSGLLS